MGLCSQRIMSSLRKDLLQHTFIPPPPFSTHLGHPKGLRGLSMLENDSFFLFGSVSRDDANWLILRLSVQVVLFVPMLVNTGQFFFAGNTVHHRHM